MREFNADIVCATDAFPVAQMGWDRGEGQHAGQCERGFYGEQRNPGTIASHSIEDSSHIINVVVFYDCYK